MYCNVYVFNLPTDVKRYISDFLPNPVINAKKYRSDVITTFVKKNIKKYITWYNFCMTSMGNQLEINEFCIQRQTKLNELLNCKTYQEIFSLIRREDPFYRIAICSKIAKKISRN